MVEWFSELCRGDGASGGSNGGDDGATNAAKCGSVSVSCQVVISHASVGSVAINVLSK